MLLAGLPRQPRIFTVNFDNFFDTSYGRSAKTNSVEIGLVNEIKVLKSGVNKISGATHKRRRFSCYGRAVAARCDASTLLLKKFSLVIIRLTLDRTLRREVILGSRRQGTISGFP
uniref:Uncharacterized protein n=1 Tax=Echinococcus canadensis TaxID=519352 RepID=A0A915EXN8_9CEST